MVPTPRIPLRTVPLPEKLTSGKLHLTSMPGRYGPLAAFLDEIRKANVAHVLCLVADEEIAEKPLLTLR